MALLDFITLSGILLMALGVAAFAFAVVLISIVLSFLLD
jgi:hypothetical protein